MTGVTKRRVNWTKIEESIASIGFGMLLIYLAPLNFLIDIVGGILIVPGAGYLIAQPEVRVALKVIVNRVSRRQVFKNTGSISGSNIIGPVDTGGGPLTISQSASQPKAPFLRAVPILTYMPLGDEQYLELAVDISNIGDGIATDIEGKSTLKGPETLALPDSGEFQVHPLGPGETKRVRIVVENAVKVTRQFYDIRIQYRDTNTKEVQSIGTERLVKDLKIDNFLQGLGFEQSRG